MSGHVVASSEEEEVGWEDRGMVEEKVIGEVLLPCVPPQPVP